MDVSSLVVGMTYFGKVDSKAAVKIGIRSSFIVVLLTDGCCDWLSYLYLGGLAAVMIRLCFLRANKQ